MATCLIGLGANLGDRAANLATAVERLSAIPQVTGVRESSVHVSKAAVGGASQGEFLNSAVIFQTSLAPTQVLTALQQIEDQLGRRRQDRWAARTIDLDLLLYDDLALSDPELVLPHPRMAFRRFVLEPAAEIAPDFVHPTTDFTIRELLTQLNRLPRRIVISGVSSEQTAQFASEVVAKSPAVVASDQPTASLSDEMSRLRASPSCQTAIELVHQRRDELRRARQGCTQADAVKVTEVSSSWIGECLAMAKLVLSSDALNEFERTWKNEPDAYELDRATLVAVVVAPSENAPDEDVLHGPLQAEIKRLATCQRQSPCLLLDATDSAWAITELVAAIEAMQ